jgi:hypothetical protein
LRIKAGWAKKPFTIPEGVLLAGYEGEKPRVSTGVHDTLYVRALSFEQNKRRFCLASCDVLALDTAFAETAARKAGSWGIAAGDFFIAATHTHSGPSGLFGGDEDFGALLELVMGRSNPPLMKIFESCVFSAVEDSVRDMQSCVLSSLVVKSPGIGGNRNNPELPGDQYLTVLKLEAEDGGGVLLYNTACHPTVLNSKNLLVSADFPGETARLLERGAVKAALFLNGSAGDVSTRYTRRGADFEELERLSALLEQQVSAAAEKTEAPEECRLESSSLTVDLKIRRGQDTNTAMETLNRLKAEFETAKKEGKDGLRLLEARCEGVMLGLLYSRHQPRAQSRRITVRFFRAGRVVFAFFPVELFSALSNPLREQMPWFVPVSYAGGYLGYLPDGAIANTDNYEKYTTVFDYGQGEKLMDAVKRHLEENYAR